MRSSLKQVLYMTIEGVYCIDTQFSHYIHKVPKHQIQSPKDLRYLVPYQAFHTRYKLKPISVKQEMSLLGHSALGRVSKQVLTNQVFEFHDKLLKGLVGCLPQPEGLVQSEG